MKYVFSLMFGNILIKYVCYSQSEAKFLIPESRQLHYDNTRNRNAKAFYRSPLYT